MGALLWVLGACRYAQSVADELRDRGLFVDVNESNETLGKRLRSAQELRPNYVVVVGGAEVETETLSVRKRDSTTPVGSMSLQSFCDILDKELKEGPQFAPN
jgi:threonyl-tRNA synthetase